jgi:hypothetical protein
MFFINLASDYFSYWGRICKGTGEIIFVNITDLIFVKDANISLCKDGFPSNWKLLLMGELDQSS